MAVLPTLIPTGVITTGDWTDEAGGTSDLRAHIDETGAADGAHIRSTTGDTAFSEFTLTNMPADFESMTSIDIEIRHSRGSVEAGSAGGDDTKTLSVQIVDSAGSGLTNQVTIETGTVGYSSKTEVVTLTGVVASDKATWDDARLRIILVHSQSMGNDGHRIWVDFARIINGVYVASASLSQVGFRFRNDDGSETTATWKAAENIDLTGFLLADRDTNIRLRFVIDETGGVAANDIVFQLQRQLNGGGWVDVTGASSLIRASASTQFADEAATTRQLTSGTGTFSAGRMDENDGEVGVGGTIDIAAGNLTELEFCFQIRSADTIGEEVIDFRVVRNATGALEAHPQIATITLEAGPPQPGWGGGGFKRVYRTGPVRSRNGALYMFGRERATSGVIDILVFKSVDNGVNWTELGSIAGITGTFGDPSSLTVAIDPDGVIIRIVWATNDATTDYLEYAAWDTSDDTIEHATAHASTVSGDIAIGSVGVGIKTNGQVIVACNEDNDAHVFRRATNGVWTDHSIDLNGSWDNADLVVLGNEAHVFYYKFDQGTPDFRISHWVLRGDNTLSSEDIVSAVGFDNNMAAFAVSAHGRFFVCTCDPDDDDQVTVWHSSGVAEDETWTPTDFANDPMDRHAGTLLCMPMVLTAGGKVIAAWVRGSDQAVQYREWDEGSQSWNSIVTTSDTLTADGVSHHFSLTTDGFQIWLWIASQQTSAEDSNFIVRKILIGADVNAVPPEKKRRDDKKKKLVYRKYQVSRRARGYRLSNRPPLNPIYLEPEPGEALLQIINETLEIAEARQNIKGLIHIRDEAVESPEAIQRHLGIVRIRNEAVETAEVVLRILSIIRLRSESIELAEALQKHLGIVRLRNESVEVAEAIQNIIGILRQRNETVEVSEATLSSLGKTQVMNESVEISEAVQRHLGIVRQRSESVEIAEAIQRHLSILRLHNEAVELSESIQKHLGIIRTQNESVSVTESIIKVLGLVRQVNEVLEIVEATQKVGGKIRQIDEAVEINEANQNIRGIFRQVNETVELVEALQRHLGIVRTRNETIELAEQIIRLVAIVRQVNESVEVAEQIIKLLAIVRQQNESVQVTEAILRILGLVRQHSESVELSETLLSFLGKIRVEGESVSISEATQTILGKIQVHNESVEIVEVIVRPSGIIQVIDESLSSSEATQKHLAIIRLINESTDITDQSMRVMALLRLVSEAVQLPEQSITVQAIVRQVSEAVSVVETIQHHLGKAIILNETVDIHETELHFTVFQAFSSTKIKFKAKINDQRYTQKVGKSFKAKVRE